MSIAVEVSLLSGKTATVQAGLDEKVNSVILQAQLALGVSKGRLVGASGFVLDGSALTKHASIRNGDVLTFHASKVQVQATSSACVAVLGDGSVVIWHIYAACGGHGSDVKDHLKNVQQIQASFDAFDAILGDGSVVTWGHDL